MVMVLMAAAKLPFLHWFKLSPLLWPFNLYLPLARQLPRLCNAISNASSLFTFRLRQILAQGPHYDPRGRSRWERAFRLFCQEVLPGPAYLQRNSIEEATLYRMHLTVAL